MLEKLPLNFALLSNPLNWLTVVLMLLVAGFAFELFFISHPNCGCQPRKE